MDHRPNFFSDKISITFLVKSEKKSKTKDREEMFTTVDSFIVLGIQDLKQIAVLSLIFIDIGVTELFNNFIQKYPPKNFIYRFRLTSITVSTIMKNFSNTILITCIGLNKCKKADANGKEVSILGVIHTETLNNREQLKETLSGINIDLVDYLHAQEAPNLSFSFLTEFIYISKFDLYLKNGKNEDIIFEEGKKKYPNLILQSTLYMVNAAMSSFNRKEIKRILTRTMEDVKKFQKISQLDKKKISELNEKINLLVKKTRP